MPAFAQLRLNLRKALSNVSFSFTITFDIVSHLTSLQLQIVHNTTVWVFFCTSNIIAEFSHTSTFFSLFIKIFVTAHNRSGRSAHLLRRPYENICYNHSAGRTVTSFFVVILPGITESVLPESPGFSRWLPESYPAAFLPPVPYSDGRLRLRRRWQRLP